jgi:hypothetical protein
VVGSRVEGFIEETCKQVVGLALSMSCKFAEIKAMVCYILLQLY